ncbi:MAG: hypothetical protein ACM3PX_05450 [Omnitrophica WOR_2 bacterium]
MKKIILFIGITLFCFKLNAQPLNPVTAFSNVPSINNVCGLNTEYKDRYMKSISDEAQIVEDELHERRMARKAKEGDYQKQAEAKVATQYGLSESDMQKMKSKNMSEADKAAMMDKMMQNSAGMSMAEVQNLKEMDKESKQAWAEGYSTQKMAEQSVDPEKAKKEQLDNMNKFELVQAQQKLNDSLNACVMKYMKKFQEIDDDKSIVTLRKEIDSLRGELYGMMGVDYGQGGEMEALFSSIKGKCAAYCSNFTSRYIDVLNDYKQFVGASIPAYNRLQTLTIVMNEKQSGIKMEELPGTFALESISNFYKKMGDLDKYYLMSPSVDINGNEN